MSMSASLLCALFAATCSASDPGTAAHPDRTDPPASSADTPLAIVNATVITMASPALLERQTIVVQGGKITAVGVGASIPSGATVVDAAGRFVMPGLIDMHVHVLKSTDLASYTRWGVTTVRNMWGFPQIQTWQREIEAGSRPGPALVSASPGVDAPPSQWPAAQYLVRPSDADSIVTELKKAGWPFIKAYTQLSLPAFDALLAAARARNIPVRGHVPLAVPVGHALDAGLAEIEHLSGYDIAVSASGRSGTWGWIDAVPARFDALVQQTIRAGAANCATLAIYNALAAQHSSAERASVVVNRRAFVRALAAAGATLVIGTDAGIDVVAPGSSMHDELAEFVAAGLANMEVLKMATVGNARVLGRQDLGTVAVGQQADLLVLERNPLTDIANTKRIGGVVMRGAWMPVQ